MEDIGAIGVLQDPVRRRLYEYVAGRGEPVSRNEAAAAVGIQRPLAAHHLDKMVAAGLLETESRRLSGRSGPGAGRPAKLYRRAAAERQISLPPRDYRTAADLLAQVAEEARLDAALAAAARRRGGLLRGDREPVCDLGDAAELLTARGYEPFDEDGVLRMRNCPFHALAEAYPPLVCGMNLALLEGLLGDSNRVRARIDPRPGLCCVAVEASKTNEN
ncbi:helix-turn-helix domain-containing protein [Nocardia otitidiscaviarum]|uniref:helix-turn-helix transcriptional regulator n=1 Tax=Nocardia otitidiscaviarum TaxID=1823 RepID=UPI00189451DA|nr:helix-turn-helix domain-containing protein [Nocardia otitidiscaviarum]MBF6240102.1 helix-turn-helix domain-containing protein [Nocardia otitidiscaviarum]